jgi:hypothetical protein
MRNSENTNISITVPYLTGKRTCNENTLKNYFSKGFLIDILEV